MAAGFSGGELRIFNYINKEVVATFRGHRSAVSAISYERSGSIVASGGCDSDIFLWDLVTLTGEKEGENSLEGGVESLDQREGGDI